MKIIAALMLAIDLISTASAQGTTEFRATLEPVAGFEWPYEPTRALFSLNGHVLNGTATYMIPADTTFIRIENAAQTKLFSPASIVSLAPETAWLATWTDVQLTDADVDELFHGDWRINVGGGSYPDGALIGQLQVVPEPSAYALVTIGGLVVAFSILLRQKRIYPACETQATRHTTD